MNEASDDSISEGNFLLEYYRPSFARLAAALARRGHRVKEPHPLRARYWRSVKARTYEQQDAIALLDAYIVKVSQSLQALLSGHCAAYWLHAYRRIGVGAISSDERLATVLLTRDTLDAAIQQFGSTGRCSGLQLSSTISPGRILDGILCDPKWRVLHDGLARNPSYVLCDFGVRQLAAVYEAEQLAFEICRAMQTRRGVGKGGLLEVRHSPDVLFHARVDEVTGRAISRFDERTRVFSSTSTATVFETNLDDRGFAVLPRFRAISEGPSPLFNDLAVKLADAEAPADFRPNFDWQPIDLKSYYRSHRPFAASFHSLHGVSLESVLVTIAAMSWNAFLSWKDDFGAMYRHWQRAYDGPVALSALQARYTELAPMGRRVVGVEEDADVDIEGALAFFTLSVRTRTQIDLVTRGPHCALIPVDNEYYIDYAHLFSRLYHLFLGVTLSDQNFKGTALEEAVRGSQQGPVGPSPCRHLDGSKQVDASFAVNRTLVIVECRARAISLAFERGDPAAVKLRAERVIEPLFADVDDKARWLASRPRGLNYDISSFDVIVPVGVTPFVEYVPPRPDLWIDETNPRLLTSLELRELLEHPQAEYILRQCPAKIFVKH